MWGVSRQWSCWYWTPPPPPRPLLNDSSSSWESSETSSCVSFRWFVPQQRCRLEACTHRNWFHLAVGSPWQFQIRSLTSSFDWPIGLLDPVPAPSCWYPTESSQINSRVRGLGPGKILSAAMASFTSIFQQLLLSRLMRLWYSQRQCSLQRSIPHKSLCRWRLSRGISEGLGN